VSEDRPSGFIRRWSNRKLDPQARRHPHRASAERAPTIEKASDEQFAEFDFDALNFDSDYRQFMSGAVSDQVRDRALQKLWTSSDLIAQPDDLDEYREDFRDEAKAAGIVRSAYRIGRGFLDDEDDNHDNPRDERSRDVVDGDLAAREVQTDAETEAVEFPDTDEAERTKMQADSAQKA
jgi:hypothetical protein